MGFLEFFNDKLLKEELEIEKSVIKDAERSYKNRKTTKKKMTQLDRTNIFELPYKIRELGVKIKHFDPKDGKVKIQLFNAESVLIVTKYLKDIGIKNFDVNESNLEINIKQG